MSNDQKTRRGDRQRKLSVWVTDAELQQVNDQAEAEGVTTAALVRSWIGEKSGMCQERTDSQVSQTLERLLLELHREGVNLNQIARAVNSGNSPASQHVMSLLRDIGTTLGQIERTVKAIWDYVNN